MAAGSFSGVLGRHRRMRFVAGHLADVLVVTALCVLVVVATRPAAVSGWVDVAAVGPALTLVAAAAGSAAAIVALVTGRLSGDPRPSWYGAALLLYGVVVLPTWALFVLDRPAGVARLAVLAVLFVGMCILVVALRPPARLGAWGGWVLAGLGLLLGGVVAVQEESPFTRLLASSPVPTIVVQAGWATVALLFLFDGYRRQSRTRARLGLGLLVIAVSQLYRAVTPGAPALGLVYPALRILGMAVVLAALLTLALQAVSRLRDDYDRLQETLGDATLLLERATRQATERDHELRNGLAGLAGAAHLLAHDDGDAGSVPLRDAVLTELGRLRELLEDPPVPAAVPGDAVPGSAGGEEDPAGAALLDLGPEFAPLPAVPHPVPHAVNGHAHEVGGVLRQLVSLRPEQEITLDVDGDLPAVAVPEAVTRQVVTNLLANCARHAPGAAVRVRGRAAEAPGYVAVEVRDTGPGLPGGQEKLVISRGVHDPAAGGSGLGLYISAELAHRHGGDLVLRTVHAPQGCLAVLTLPADR